MSGPGEPVTVHILDREFHVGCAPEERQGVIAAARYLDERMREMRNTARTAGLDRIAILAALNICHELLNERERGASEAHRLAEKLQAIHSKLERVLPASIQ